MLLNYSQRKYYPVYGQKIYETSIEYVVYFDGEIEYVSADYLVATAYVVRERSRFGWGNKEYGKRWRIGLRRKGDDSFVC